MTRPLHFPGNGVRMLFVKLGERDDPRYSIPLAYGELQGLQCQVIMPGDTLERPALKIAWIVVIDDRAPDASGPGSFDAGTLRWLFADASAIAVDAAEPHMGVYEYFVEEGVKGRRILVIQTCEDRLAAWREFSQQNCDLYGILEVVPPGNNPEGPFKFSVTRFAGPTTPQG
jgi:hypothetical protein